MRKFLSVVCGFGGGELLEQIGQDSVVSDRFLSLWEAKVDGIITFRFCCFVVEIFDGSPQFGWVRFVVNELALLRFFAFPDGSLDFVVQDLNLAVVRVTGSELVSFRYPLLRFVWKLCYNRFTSSRGTFCLDAEIFAFLKVASPW